MVQVYSKEELQKAIANNEKSIMVCGAYAQEMKSKYQRRKKAKKGSLIAGGALALAGLVAMPFTGGASGAATAVGAGMMGLTIGTITLTTAELAIIAGITAGFGLGVVGLAKGFNVSFKPTGEVLIEKK
ncbi:MAG: hypothetical protein J6C57_03745 [Paludibacteraceae bacterium]|nr:hypothetical protein [Paludibacteraceae bacterium]MBP3575222.1 hypothetical protein [Paludibacteraceae bacterium]